MWHMANRYRGVYLECYNLGFSRRDWIPYSWCVCFIVNLMLASSQVRLRSNTHLVIKIWSFLALKTEHLPQIIVIFVKYKYYHIDRPRLTWYKALDVKCYTEDMAPFLSLNIHRWLTEGYVNNIKKHKFIIYTKTFT